jgi:hypothetical protein
MHTNTSSMKFHIKHIIAHHNIKLCHACLLIHQSYTSVLSWNLFPTDFMISFHIHTYHHEGIVPRQWELATHSFRGLILHNINKLTVSRACPKDLSFSAMLGTFPNTLISYVLFHIHVHDHAIKLSYFCFHVHAL